VDDAPLSFDKADFSGGSGATACGACKTPLIGSYFAIGEQVICGACHERLVADSQPGNAGGRFFGGLGLGLLGAVLGAAIWSAVMMLANLQLGIIAIAVGYLVGKGVNIGSRGVGGWLYRGAAIVLTYVGVSLAWVPGLVQSMDTLPELHGIERIVAIVILSPTLPIVLGLKSPMSFIILAIALWEAWRLNRRVSVVVTGPHRVAQPFAGTIAPPPPPTS